VFNQEQGILDLAQLPFFEQPALNGQGFGIGHSTQIVNQKIFVHLAIHSAGDPSCLQRTDPAARQDLIS